MMHPNRESQEENARRFAWKTKELLDKLKTQKGSLQGVEEKTGRLGGIQRICPGIHRAVLENSDRIKSRKGCQGQQKKSFYRYIGGKKKTAGNVGPLQKETGEMVT